MFLTTLKIVFYFLFYLLLKWPLHCIVFLFIFTLLYVLLTYFIDLFCFKWPLHCIAIYLFLYLLNWIYIIYFMSCHFTWAQICKCNFIVLILDFCITHFLLLLLFVCLFIWGKEIDKRRIKFRNFGNRMQTFVAHTICCTKWNQIFSTSLAVHLISYWRRKQKRVLRKRKERVYIARHSRDTTRALVVWSS